MVSRNMVRGAAAALSVLLAGAAGTAWAQDANDITLEAHVWPQFSDGKLTGCQAPFKVLHADHAAFGGKRVVLDGSLGVWLDNEGVAGIMLKLGVTPLGDEEGVAPSSFYLRNGLKTNAADLFKTGPSDQEGYRLFIYDQGEETLNALTTLATTNRLYGTYALREGGLGSNFVVRLEVQAVDLKTGEMTLDETAGQRLLDCVGALVGA